MSVYVIAHFRVHDREGYLRYMKAARPLIAAHRGNALAADDAPIRLHEASPDGRLVLIEFPTQEAARAWIDSPEYRAVAWIREAATETHSVLLVRGLT